VPVLDASYFRNSTCFFTYYLHWHCQRQNYKLSKTVYSRVKHRWNSPVWVSITRNILIRCTAGPSAWLLGLRVFHITLIVVFVSLHDFYQIKLRQVLITELLTILHPHNCNVTTQYTKTISKTALFSETL